MARGYMASNGVNYINFDSKFDVEGSVDAFDRYGGGRPGGVPIARFKTPEIKYEANCEGGDGKSSLEEKS